MRTLFLSLLCASFALAQTGARIINPVTVEKPMTITSTGELDGSFAAKTKPTRVGTSAPTGSCDPGEQYLHNKTVPDAYDCNSAGAWVKRTGSGSGSSYTPADNTINFFLYKPTTGLGYHGDINSTPDSMPTTFYPFSYSHGVTIKNYGTIIDNLANNGWLIAAIYDHACNKVSGSDATPLQTNGYWSKMVVPNGGTNKITLPAGDYYLGWKMLGGQSIMFSEDKGGSAQNELSTPYRTWAASAATAEMFHGDAAHTGSGSSAVMPATCGNRSNLANNEPVYFFALIHGQ